MRFEQAMTSDDPERDLNPYAASKLYEPKPAKPRVQLAAPLHARGIIPWPLRKRAFLLVYGATVKDIVGMTAWVVFPGSFVLALTLGPVLDPSWTLFLILGLWLLTFAYMLVRRRLAVRVAWRQQLEHAGRELAREIDGDGVRLAGARDPFIPWSDFALCRQRPDMLVLVLRDKQQGFQIYPRAHFASLAEWGLFCRLVEYYVQCI
jgi:hypothetical protein